MPVLVWTFCRRSKSVLLHICVNKRNCIAGAHQWRINLDDNLSTEDTCLIINIESIYEGNVLLNVEKTRVWKNNKNTGEMKRFEVFLRWRQTTEIFQTSRICNFHQTVASCVYPGIKYLQFIRNVHSVKAKLSKYKWCEFIQQKHKHTWFHRTGCKQGSDTRLCTCSFRLYCSFY